MIEEEEENQKRMTKQELKTLLRSNMKMYYGTPSLNDTLYLHFKGTSFPSLLYLSLAILSISSPFKMNSHALNKKGYHRIENLEEFTGLKCIYLEANGKTRRNLI